LAQQGNDRIHNPALLLGWLTALLPSLVLLLAMLSGRIRQVRSMGAAEVVLANRADPALRQLLASRAAFGLPYDVLLGYTRDTFGDLAAGRYDALIRATLGQAGLHAAPVGSADAGVAVPQQHGRADQGSRCPGQERRPSLGSRRPLAKRGRIRRAAPQPLAR
jgi:hypothetical protein